MKKVKIYRNGKQYYYTYENETEEITGITLNKLQTKLTLPFEIVFNNMSLAQRQKIIGTFMTNCMNIQYGLTEFDEHKVTFTKRRYRVHAYCMPSKINTEGRSEGCRPYVLRTIGEDKVLMEVTRDYILNHDEQYYYLHQDMTERERTFFSPVYRVLEVDYVYQLVNKIEKEQVLGRRKK